jgi:S-formylglutathione hydrolase
MLIKASLACPEVPEPVEYAALRPDGNHGDALPLLYLLHGGGGSRDYLERVAPALERAWAEGSVPPLVAVTPTVADQTFYMNLHDGTERWEDALIGSFLDHVREAHGGSRERQLTMTYGPSMGGTGSLRLAFKHPDVFGAVAALEPGIQPALDFAEIDPRDLFWRTPESLRRAFGHPTDDRHWRANNPASIVADGPGRLRDAGLAIYLECGDEDSFGLHRGAEFLHRILFDNGIRHEYRLVRGADHVGATLPGRFRDALAFLARVIAPPPPDPALAAFHQQIARMKLAAGLERDRAR